jgi:hypothetical protein
MAKQFKITQTNSRGSVTSYEGTVVELTQMFSYSLDCGRSWEREKGNKKINTTPKTIKSLVTNIENAKNNSTTNGYAGFSYDYCEI